MKNATSFSSWHRCLLSLLGLLGICSGAFAAPPRPPALLAGPTPVGNYVFLDANLNNVFDAAETGIPGVRVCLYTSDGVLRETATTTATGLFSFTSTIQPNTSYDIRIKAADAPANRRLVVAKQGGDPTADSDASMVGNTAVIVVQSSPTGTLPTALGFGYAAGDPDLILTKVSDSFSVAKGGTATFTLSVSNVGGSTATGVVVRDTLDAGMGYVSSSPAGTTALLGSGNVQVTWTTGTLSAGSTATYTLTVSALTDGVLTNTAGVTATSTDGTPRNNLASASFSVPAKLCQGGAYVTTLAPNLTNVEWFKAGASVGTGNSLTIVTSGSYSYTAFSVGSACQVVSCSPVIIYDGSVPNLTLASSASAICVGQSSVLSVSNCTGTVLWNTGAATTSITVSPTITTGYSVTCTPTAADACPSSVSATITVNPSVTATMSSATICNGTVATIKATGGTSYTLSDGQVNGTGSFTVTPSLTTLYSVTVANSSGCTGLASSTVTVNPSVTATLSSATICNGLVASLSATGGTSYAFSNGVTNTTGILSVTPTATTPYTVTVTNGFGCSAIATGTVTVNPAVTATVANQTICNGLTATLSASAAGGTGITYLWAPAGTGNTQSVTVSPSATTSYTVTATNSDGCSTTAVATVTVNPAVTAVIAANPSTTICNGTSTTLTASATGGAGFTYIWNTGAITASIPVSPTATTVYTVTATNGFGCSSTASTTITVNPSVTATLTSSTICYGTSTTLTASGGTSYLFSNGVTNTTGVISVTPLVTTPYTVTVTNGNGCSAIATGTVTVNPAVTATVANQTICNGTTATLSASATGGTGLTYVWSPAGTGNTQSVTVSPSLTTSYTVTVTNSNGCSTTATATVTVNPSVTATLSSATICNGTVASLSASGGTSYLFSNGVANTTGILSVTPTATTPYTVTVTNGFGCSAIATGTVTVNPALTATIGVTPSLTICQGNTVALTANATGGATYNYTWSTGATSQTITASPTSTTVYSVTISEGTTSCSAVASTTITVNPTPVLSVNSPTICQEQTTVLSLTGCAGTVTWSTGTTGATLEVTPLQTTSYTATCGLSTGCSATIVATVTVTPTPVVQRENVVVTRATCAGATANNDASIALTGLQNTVRVSISAANGTTTPAFGTAIAVTGTAYTFAGLPNPAQPVTYLISLYGTNGTCTSTVTVTLNPADCTCPAPKCVPVVVRKIR